jgi:hypothetical protein
MPNSVGLAADLAKLLAGERFKQRLVRISPVRTRLTLSASCARVATAALRRTMTGATVRSSFNYLGVFGL